MHRLFRPCAAVRAAMMRPLVSRPGPCGTTAVQGLTTTTTSTRLAWRGAATPRTPASACRARLSPHCVRPPPRLCRSMPGDEDLDAALITRRGIASLERLQQQQQQQAGRATADTPTADSGGDGSASDSSSSNSSSSSSVERDESGLSWAEVQEHKRAAVQQAFLNDSLGFGFSAGGLVFPYYVGLVSSLVQQGVLTRPAHLAGSSAGSLIAASFNAGLDMSTVEASLVAFGEDCLKNGTRYRLGPLLRQFLQDVLPPDAHEACSGTTHVAVTRLLPYWRTQMVSQFGSRDDLIAALLTSCHIPWYLDGRWMTKFRGHYCVDGGVMAFIPRVPEIDYTVKVMCFPSSHLSTLKGVTAGRAPLKRLHRLLDIDITMDSFEEWPYDLQQVVKWALLASAQETSSLLIEKGKRDAAAWVAAMELAPLVEARRAQQQQQQQQQQGQGVVLGGGQQQPQESASWSDDKASSRRQQEAADAQAKAAAAEQAAGELGGGLHEVAAAAGVQDRAAVKHAAELAASGAGEPPNKRHKVAAAAAVPAAAAAKVAEGLGSLLRGGEGGEGGGVGGDGSSSSSGSGSEGKGHQQ